MNNRLSLLALLAAGFLLAGCGGATLSPGASARMSPTAHAVIQPVGGSTVSGTVRFSVDYDGTEIRYALTGLSPGPHGFHVHEVGNCGPGTDGTPGGAAGGHYNPFGAIHGAPDAPRERRHAGDLGNILADASGASSGAMLGGLIALDGPNTIVGRAVVIHSGADDLSSQPSGEAGTRVGCGVVVAGN